MLLCIFGLFIYASRVDSILLVIPEDVPTGFAAIYGFSPPFTKGNDHRFGFGFRFGNHADFQILYEFGPQLTTKPLQAVPRIRSTTYRRDRVRRPILDFLIRSGIIKQTSYRFNILHDCDEPR